MARSWSGEVPSRKAQVALDTRIDILAIGQGNGGAVLDLARFTGSIGHVAGDADIVGAGAIVGMTLAGLAGAAIEGGAITKLDQVAIFGARTFGIEKSGCLDEHVAVAKDGHIRSTGLNEVAILAGISTIGAGDGGAVLDIARLAGSVGEVLSNANLEGARAIEGMVGEGTGSSFGGAIAPFPEVVDQGATSKWVQGTGGLEANPAIVDRGDDGSAGDGAVAVRAWIRAGRTGDGGAVFDGAGGTGAGSDGLGDANLKWA